MEVFFLQVEKPKCKFFQCRYLVVKGKNKGDCQQYRGANSEHRICSGTHCSDYQCSTCIRTGTCIKEPEFQKQFL